MPKMEKADAVEAMLSEMRCAQPTVSLQGLIERLRHMHDIRDGSPNAFYAAFDAIWKAVSTHMSQRDDRTNARNNARLIAAAPELLATLQQVRDFYLNADSAWHFSEGFPVDTVIAAIAKTEGE